MALCHIQWGYLYLGISSIEELYMQSWRLCLRFLLNLSSRVWRAYKRNNLLQGSSIWYCWHSLKCTSNHELCIRVWYFVPDPWSTYDFISFAFHFFWIKCMDHTPIKMQTLLEPKNHYYCLVGYNEALHGYSLYDPSTY